MFLVFLELKKLTIVFEYSDPPDRTFVFSNTYSNNSSKNENDFKDIKIGQITVVSFVSN